MTATATPLEQSEEGRAFLQRRAARFGLFAAGFGWFFLVYRTVEALLLGHYWEFSHPSYPLHFLAGSFPFVLWLGCRGGPLCARRIRRLEAVAVIGAAATYAAMGWFSPLIARPDFLVLLAVTYGLMARAIYVPSSAWRTLVLSAASAVAPLIMTYDGMLAIELDKWAPLVPVDATAMSERAIARSVTAFNAGWWLCAIVICTAAPKVIYGLREEVRDARRLGQYTLEEKLGEGGMGIVYRARHAMLRRPTAVKLLPQDKTGERSLKRFEREVQLTALLSHPNTVTIYDYGRTPDGVFYYVMELLAGADLAEVVAAAGPQPPARVVRVLTQVSGALAEAHGVDLIHRDIKPHNIMLVEQGGVADVAKVLDFGLVKELHRDQGASLTHADTLTGTPQYMPPESITDPESVDGRSDLYALGAVGYYLLTGTHVFTGKSVVEVCGHHLHSQPVPPSERLGSPLPAGLEALLLQCLAKSPAERPASAAELAARLGACADVGTWTEGDARAWWEAHGAVLAARRRRPPDVAVAGTIEVDLRDRETIARTRPSLRT